MTARRRTWSAVPAAANESHPPTGNTPSPATADLELFQAASSAGFTTDGYALWKAEVAAERDLAEQTRSAQELPASADEAGYQAWKAAELAARQALEQRWGVPIGKPVRLRLRGEALEREGILRILEQPADSLHAAARSVRLGLGGHAFTLAEIEQVTRL